MKNVVPRPSIGSFLFATTGLVSLIIFLVLVWIPELRHNYVRTETIDANAIEAGRTTPPDAVLKELSSHRLIESNWRDNTELIETADKLLAGWAEIPGLEKVPVHLPFDARDLDRGSSAWQLEFASLALPEVLIDAYRLTGREEYFALARDMILGWASYEKRAWLNHGFLWNDHAVATRARTLADFWSIYRGRKDYDPAVASRLWIFAARTRALLAKPDQFTVATNHGVMQNVAILQICIAFPSLPRTEEYKNLAFSRLVDQMSFYVSPDGVVLEHSADYQEFGTYLIGLILRYATLLHLEIPPDWEVKYEKAKQFYSVLRRPDGSLPPFGDGTIGGEHHGIPFTSRNPDGSFGPLLLQSSTQAREGLNLYGTGGYAVLWDSLEKVSARDPRSQTVVAWSDFPGHGHKHADDMSVLFWADNQQWWTNSGYWPYDDMDRIHAECWEGANAPHLVGEACPPMSTTRLVSWLNERGLFALEMERSSAGGATLRRLVIHLLSSMWIVVDDSAASANSTLRTIWTTAPNIAVETSGGANQYVLSKTDHKDSLRVWFLGAPSMTVKRYRGSRDPFVGWISLVRTPVAANAMVTEQSAKSGWGMTIWMLDRSQEGKQEGNREMIVKWRGERSWEIEALKDGREGRILRDGKRIEVEGYLKAGGIDGELKQLPARNGTEIERLHRAFREAARSYPRFRDLTSYRKRASLFGLALFALQEICLALYGWIRGRFLVPIRIFSLLAWGGLCVWATFFYLR